MAISSLHPPPRFFAPIASGLRMTEIGVSRDHHGATPLAMTGAKDVNNALDEKPFP